MRQEEGGSFFFVCFVSRWLSDHSYFAKKKNEEEKKREDKREGQDTSKETTHGQDGDVDGMGWDGMDGWMACLFPFYLPSITAIAIRYLAVGSG